MKKLLLSTMALALLALATQASAASNCPGQTDQSKCAVYDIERIWIHFIGDFDGRGWLYMEDIAGLRSRMELLVRDVDATILYNCHPVPAGGNFNIVQIGTFAQQATGTTGASFMRGQCGTHVTKVVISCPFAGLPAPQSFAHVTVNHAGTYRGENTGAPSSYKLTGHRDIPDFCAVAITSGPEFNSRVEVFEGLAIAVRLKSAHTGDTGFIDFWRDPADWLNLFDATFPIRSLETPTAEAEFEALISKVEERAQEAGLR